MSPKPPHTGHETAQICSELCSDHIIRTQVLLSIPEHLTPHLLSEHLIPSGFAASGSWLGKKKKPQNSPTLGVVRNGFCIPGVLLLLLSRCLDWDLGDGFASGVGSFVLFSASFWSGSSSSPCRERFIPLFSSSRSFLSFLFLCKENISLLFLHRKRFIPLFSSSKRRFLSFSSAKKTLFSLLFFCREVYFSLFFFKEVSFSPFPLQID